MEVHFTPDTQTQLQQVAASEGKDAERVVQETVTRMLQRRAQFLEGVERGVAAADRGEFVEDDEVRRWLRSGNAPDAYPLDATRIK
jgi:predicted transcriptional regulator